MSAAVSNIVSFVTLASKFGSFDRYIKSKLKIMSLEVTSAYHTEYESDQ